MLKLIPLLLVFCFQQNGFVCPAPYCPFFREARSADLVAIVTLENATKVETDKELRFTIQKTLKAPKSEESLKKFVIPYEDRPINLTIPHKEYLIFADVKPGKINLFRMEYCSQEMKKYADGLLECADNAALLHYVFPYLESGYTEVALDAYTTFKEQSENDLYAARTSFDPVKLRTWLNTKSPDFWKYSLYTKLLGYCGNASDVPLLKQHLEQQATEGNSVSEYLIAIIELSPNEGWGIASKLIRSIQGEGSFQRRYAVHCAICHVKDSNRALPSAKTLRDILDTGLSQEDFADLSIHFIRRWKMWEYSSKIIALYKSEGSPLVNRSIVLMALQSPEPQCQAFITQLRKNRPELVKNCEESLQLEKEGLLQQKK